MWETIFVSSMVYFAFNRNRLVEEFGQPAIYFIFWFVIGYNSECNLEGSQHLRQRWWIKPWNVFLLTIFASDVLNEWVECKAVPLHWLCTLCLSWWFCCLTDSTKVMSSLNEAFTHRDTMECILLNPAILDHPQLIFFDACSVILSNS